MRFITIIVLLIKGSLYAQNYTCEDGFTKRTISFNQFEITECNCECTTQENIFFIYNKQTESTIKMFGASKIMIHKNNYEYESAAMNYFMSKKKNCTGDVVPEKKALNFFSLVPYENGSCYEYSAYIDSTGNLNVIKPYISTQLFETIVPEKQYLYDENKICSQTKMYLIKGDRVQILEEKSDWLFILYNGTREIRKWIPKCAIEQ